jgi:hypothetical protein
MVSAPLKLAQRIFFEQAQNMYTTENDNLFANLKDAKFIDPNGDNAFIIKDPKDTKEIVLTDLNTKLRTNCSFNSKNSIGIN